MKEKFAQFYDSWKNNFIASEDMWRLESADEIEQLPYIIELGNFVNATAYLKRLLQDKGSFPLSEYRISKLRVTNRQCRLLEELTCDAEAREDMYKRLCSYVRTYETPNMRAAVNKLYSELQKKWKYDCNRSNEYAYALKSAQEAHPYIYFGNSFIVEYQNDDKLFYILLAKENKYHVLDGYLQEPKGDQQRVDNHKWHRLGSPRLWWTTREKKEELVTTALNVAVDLKIEYGRCCDYAEHERGLYMEEIRALTKLQEEMNKMTATPEYKPELLFPHQND